MDDYVDGVNCINIYSKAKTWLGRALSNMANTPITGQSPTGEVHVFASVEAWWYWYTTGKKHHHLKGLHGFEAKSAGRQLERVCAVTGGLFREIAVLKLRQHRNIYDAFILNSLVYVHYYDYGGKKIFPPHDITATVWNELYKDILDGRVRI